MQLNEILEENTVKAIGTKTNIAEDNIDALVSAEFDKLKRVKTMGFISIIEREYNADLSALKEQALEYYNAHSEDNKVTLGMPMAGEKKGRSKWFMFVVLILIVYAIWYAFNNFDEKKLSAMLPFSEEKLSEMIMPGEKAGVDESKEVPELSIEHVNHVNTTEVNDNSTEEPGSY